MIRRYLPILDWLPAYKRDDLPGDLVAGAVVAIMLVPQGMAYAFLAGLPPQMGLYAGIVPVVLYALFGSSRAMAVGPVAIASLMTATAIGGLAAPGSPEQLSLAILLALLIGIMLLAMGIARLGFLVNFLSHSVISGFTSAAAVLIAFSQLKYLLGIDIPRSHLITDTIGHAADHIAEVNLWSLGLGLGAIAVLLLSRKPFGRLLRALGLGEGLVAALTKTGPLLVVLFGILIVGGLDLAATAGVAIVGEIPQGLPPLTVPPMEWDLWAELAPLAFLIAVIGFLESVSVATALAARRRQKIDPNQELVGLGAANLGAAFTGAYPVAGGFGRSMVNFTSGANTPLASILTAVLLALTLVLLTPWFYALPQAVLGAIVIVAVSSLIDVKAALFAWRYDKADFFSLAATFVAVLTVGVEMGIVTGAALSLALYLNRTSRPHFAIVGRVGDTEHFRNVKRHKVKTYPHLVAMRIDESLYFANSRFLEDCVLGEVADKPEVKHLLLICSAVNVIDTSALETLERIVEELKSVGVTVHLAEVKGPVMDKLERTHFLDHLEPGRVFLSTHDAFVALKDS